MRFLLMSLLLTLTLQAQSFTQRSILGVWYISSAKANGFISFGKDLGRTRGQVWTLLFNREGRLKVQETGTVYHYEITGGSLKIYMSRVGYNGYVTKRKNQYDLIQITGKYEGCALVKTVVKKINGVKKKEGFKMCKIEEIPTPTYQRNINDYRF